MRTFERLLVRAPFQFKRETLPVAVEPGIDYLVEVHTRGICRSDIHAAASWATEWRELGHEFGGTVTDVLAADGRFRVGDQVAIRNASPCGRCDRCRTHDQRACRHPIVNMQGFRTLAACDARSLVDAQGLDQVTLALVEPTNVVLDLLHAARCRPDERVVVFGSGTLGLITAFLLRQVRRLPRVLVVGRPSQSPLARELGVGPYLSFDTDRLAEQVAAEIGGPPDCVLVTTPPTTLPVAVALSARHGRVVTVGLDDTDACAVPLDIQTLVFKQCSLRGVCASPNLHFETAVRTLRQWGSRLCRLVSHQVGYAELETALRACQERAHYDGKTIVTGI